MNSCIAVRLASTLRQEVEIVVPARDEAVDADSDEH
jgi:hypothetical protein